MAKMRKRRRPHPAPAFLALPMKARQGQDIQPHPDCGHCTAPVNPCMQANRQESRNYEFRVALEGPEEQMYKAVNRVTG